MLHPSHSPLLVMMSVLVACVASYAALQLAGRVLAARGRVRLIWLGASAFTMGVGIWSMHFVAMLAFRVGLPMAYAVDLVLLSVLVAIAASLLAFVTVSRPAPGPGALVVAGLFMGPAIAGMHYIGMSAIRMPARIEYDLWIVSLSVLVAVTASLAALRLFVAFRTETIGRPSWQAPASAVLMGFAVSGMHFTGMAAARFVPDSAAGRDGGHLLATDGLAYAVATSAAFLALVAVIAAMLDRSVRATSADAEALRESQERLQFALAAARMRTWCLDLNTRRLTPTDDGLGHEEPFDDFLMRIHADDRARVNRAVGLASDSGWLDVDFRFWNSGRVTRWIQAKGRRQDGPGRRLLGVSIDITERRHLEQQFRQAQKMEVIGQLAGGIAHDFNNLLTVIKGNTEIALDEAHASQPAREVLQEALRATEHAAVLTRQLLAFSRKEIVQPRIIDINQVILSMEQMLSRLIDEHVTVSTHLAPGAVITVADPGQIEQILVNLAVNARDAMPQGGRLSIETGHIVLDRPSFPSGVVIQAGSYVMLRVRDTGAGMDAAVQARVFEPFFTTKGPTQGTGLGLSTVYGIVTQAGGHVWVESEPGHGSTFTIYLPQASVDAGVPAVTSRAPAPAVAASETILLVEDEEGVRRLACRILMRQGYRVIEAGDGREALEIASRSETSIDLLVTDLIMPRMSGRELALRVHQHRPTLKVLFMSGYTNDEVLRRDLLDPGVAFLPKPFAPRDLLDAVHAALAAHD